MTDRSRDLPGPEPLKGLHLAAGAWRSMQANARPMLVLGVVVAVATLVVEQGAATLGVDIKTSTPAFLALALVTGLIGATVSGMATRLILQPEAPRWRVDGRLVGYVAVILLLSLVGNLLLAFYMSFVPVGPDGAPANPPVLTPAQASQMFLVMVAMIVTTWVTIRLMLWPVGLLVGDRDMRPSRSFSLMRRGVFAVILAYAVLATGPFFIYAALAGQADPWGRLIGAPFAAFISLAIAAIQAEAYRQRTRG
ncbi:hypothetical protein [Phenylobacterium sp. J367]|uniref:hypothetical protein n=1 Tax=Phenylobacterium sp. J367 TaxID=2898435 RepID=UPI0021513A80|nr:hypothetical protein [Phenylobacterium sp. J367]MCR5877079.1 hypothetical protein [Phenylobacterium sp. J367]